MTKIKLQTMKMKQETKKSLGMAAVTAVTLLLGVLVFLKHWQFELPGYANVDEQLSLDCIHDLLNQHIYAGDIYVLNFFRYPHLTFYYAVLGVRILGKLLSGYDIDTLSRFVVCGTALLSNVCIYFTIKKLTNSRKWAYIGTVLSVFSLYAFSYLYYTGPDTMLYAVANVILLLGTVLYLDKNEERCVYLWYPLLAICIGLAMSAKTHGILFGLFWLVLHIVKKYWKSYRNNYNFFMCCIVLALVFCVCNYSLFFHFPNFIGDNLYNLQHYAWGHPGIEHNFPLLGHLEVFALSGYGVVGGLLLIAGIVSLLWKKEFQKVVIYAIMPLVVIVFLSRYSIMLGRNLALVMPFAILFMVYGLMALEGLLGKIEEKKFGRQIKVFFVPGLVVLMILANIFAAVNTYRYELSYTKAVAWIEENIPEDAVIYCTSFAPNLDEETYKIIDIGEDISKLPDNLAADEYFVDVEYATGYFHQKKDYLIVQGDAMYPEMEASYEAKINKYSLEQYFDGITYGKEWRFRVGYTDFFRYSKEAYYVGPDIKIFH